MEGLPKSLIEACAIGRSIVTTDNIGCRDVVTNGMNGYLVPVKDAIALADKIKLLIDDKDLRVKMGRASRKIAENEFSIDDVINKHLDIYKELVS
jgi:glycosyltransferase involved in cell wall biosynthesis